MSARTECSGLSVATELFELVNQEIAPGAGVDPADFNYSSPHKTAFIQIARK